MKAPEGYSVEREGAHAVALDLTIDEDLRAEGQAREIVHAVQNARKTAGLEVEDRIELALGGDPALIAAAEAHRDYLTGETLAVGARAWADGSRRRWTTRAPRSTGSTRDRAERPPSCPTTTGEARPASPARTHLAGYGLRLR